MSWNKNTVYASDIPARVNLLRELGEDFDLTKIGEVRGDGLNDDYEGKDHHDIHRLSYGDVVVLERIVRDLDCDGDDVIVSYECTVGSEPKSWEIDVTRHDPMYCDCYDGLPCQYKDVLQNGDGVTIPTRIL